MKPAMNNMRKIPSVESLLRKNETEILLESFGRDLTLEALRKALGTIRQGVKNGQAIPPASEIIQNAGGLIQTWLQPSLKPVINATGIILHTNLGRAPLSRDTLTAMQKRGMRIQQSRI